MHKQNVNTLPLREELCALQKSMSMNRKLKAIWQFLCNPCFIIPCHMNYLMPSGNCC